MDNQILKRLRAVRDFFFNSLVATIGANIAEDGVSPLFHPKTWAGIYMKEAFLSAGIAFVLGWLVYFKWRHRTAFWVWSLGVCTFAWRLALAGKGAPLDIVESATLGFVSVRAVFYSLGAL